MEALPQLVSAAQAAGRTFPPTHPIVYVDPRTGLRVNAGAAVPMSGPGAGNLNLRPPSRARDLVGGLWINKLVAH